MACTEISQVRVCDFKQLFKQLRIERGTLIFSDSPSCVTESES